MTESEENDYVISLQTEDNTLTSIFADNMDDIVASENKQSKPVTDKLNGIKKELNSIENEECYNGNYRTFIKST